MPNTLGNELRELFEEITELTTQEAKLFKALDNLEGVISHNEAPLDTWLPHEYEENLIYGEENVAYSEYLMALRGEIRQDSIRKIEVKK